MVANYSVYEAIWRDNPMNWHASLIISSVEINYDLKQGVIVWNGNATCVYLTLVGCPYK